MSMSPFAWYVAMLAAGLLLVVAEVFVPGGVAGVVGGLALLAAMAVGLLWVQLFPRSRAGKRIALRTDGAAFKSAAPAPELVGAAGEAVTALRPAGIALINGKRYDVLAADGDWIAAGTAIRASAIRDGQLVVRPAESKP